MRKCQDSWPSWPRPPPQAGVRMDGQGWLPAPGAGPGSQEGACSTGFPPHTHRAAGGTPLAARQLPGMPVGDSWSPARRCHTSQGPLSVLRLCFRRQGSAGGRRGVAQNPAQDVRHPGVGAGSGRGMLTPRFQEGEAMRQGPTGDAQDGGTFVTGSGSRVVQRPGSRTGVRGEQDSASPRGHMGGPGASACPRGCRRLPPTGEMRWERHSPAWGQTLQQAIRPQAWPHRSPCTQPSAAPPHPRRVKSDSNCALFISSAPPSTGCSQWARPGLPPRSAYI